MKTSSLLSIVLLLCSIGSLQAQLKPQMAPEKVTTDEYFGVKLEDPYRYLENLNDPKVVEWMKSNANYARTKLNEVPERENIIKKMVEFDKRKEFVVYFVQITENDKFFYLKRKANEENGKLYYRTGYKGTEMLLFDPNNYQKEKGVNYTVSAYYPNLDGSKVAIEVAPNGSESSELMIMDVTGKMYPEKIDRCWYASANWLNDGNSFYYSRLNSADVTDKNRLINTKIYYHKLGDDPSKDVEFFSSKTNPELGIKPEEIPIVFYHKNSNNLFGLIFTVNSNFTLYVAPLNNPASNPSWRKVFDLDDKVVNFALDDKNTNFYFLTFKDAPNYKVIKTSFANPDLSSAETVIPESKNNTITGIAMNKDGLYYTASENGIKAKAYFLPKGKNQPMELKLPIEAGSIEMQMKNERYSDVWFSMEGWTSPLKRYMYNPANNSFTFQPMSKVAEYPELKNIVSKEVMVPSHDGVMVPVSIIYNKNTKLNGDNPVLMTGYGSYGYSYSPYFSTAMLTYCSYGGVYVVPHVRGGGELGRSWHEAGRKTTKPNTWKDLIASAEYLIKEKYTNPKRIAINGGSAGGILVGRAITERPDLFAAAIPEVGALNTVRMETTPGGPINTPEFGTVQKEEEFKALLEMDSFHHIKKGTSYPAVLITAGMNDPRVTAWEPAKFAAKLQAANSSENPILFFTDFEAGHGLGDNKTKVFEGYADVYSFAYQHTGHPKFQSLKKLQKY